MKKKKIIYPTKFEIILSFCFICKNELIFVQRQTNTQEGVQIREQIRQAPEEGGRIQLP